MATSNHATTFWHFLENYSIEIPIIQRDYAQGRIGKESLRKNFLNDLKEALDEALDKSTPPEKMKLDFIYGSTENGKLYPLDGQQRLTTLWLLHWYIALSAGKLNDASERLKKFSYETRVSSRNFCEELCNPENFKNYNLKNTVFEFIINQTWFYSAWKQDPTIQSMLRMLGGSKGKNDLSDGIEKVFGCCNCISNKENRFERYYTLLIGEDCPIVFYYLPRDFGNSDDLYIKMNARGEQLTSFENFKADLIGYITKQSEDEKEEEKQAEWKKLLDPKEGIPIKLDTDWTNNIFWKERSKGTSDGRMTNHIDEIYYAFINRFFWNELFIAKDEDDEYILDIGNGDENSTQENENTSYKYLNDSDNKNDFDTKIVYKGLDVYKYYRGAIPISFFKKLKNVLNHLHGYLKNNLIQECLWDKDFYFIPTYEKDNNGNNVEITNNASDHILKVTVLKQVQRVVFFAVCKYFYHDENVKDEAESLGRWLRVVWNLVSGEDVKGPQIRSTSAMRTAMEFIDKLDSHNVYYCLAKYTKKLSDSAFDKRCKEEISKAKQILDENGNLCEYKGSLIKKDGSKCKTWEDAIKVAEETAFFKGAIRFLFTDENGEVNDESWGNFDTKWVNAKEYFCDKGVKPKYEDNRMLFKKFLKYISDFDSLKEFYFDDSLDNWRSCILLNDKLSKCVDKLLTESPEEEKRDDWDDSQKKVFEDLTVGNILLNIDNGFKLDKDKFYMLTKKGKGNGQEWKRYFIGVERNNILSKLYGGNLNEKVVDENKIYSNQKLKDRDFFWGAHIDFIYKNHPFRWYGYPNDEELDVYLMGKKEKGELYYLKRNHELPEETTENKSCFCFRVDENTTPETFTKMLDDFITQAEADEQNTPCKDDCPNKINGCLYENTEH